MRLPPTSVPYRLYDIDHAIDPRVLVPESRYRSGNADIPWHGVMPVGPQTVTVLVESENLGSVILAGHRPYLAESGQMVTGVEPRVLAITPTPWDQAAVVNPTVDVVV